MNEKSYWNKFITWCRKGWRIIWRKYNKEIKSFVGIHIDNAFIELEKHVDRSVLRSIKKDVIKKAIANKVDIYTSSGAQWIKNEINSYMEKLGQ